MSKIILCVKHNLLLISCLVIILLSYSSYFVMGQNSYLSIFDGLDSNHVSSITNAVNIENSGLWYSFTPQPVGGVPRYPSLIPDIPTMLYLVFSPYFADIINRLVISLVAFLGMMILLSFIQKHTLVTRYDKFILFGVSLGFGLCRFWPYAGISIAGLPLMIYAYLISDRKLVLSVAISFIYAAYSSLALVGFFLLIVMGVMEFVRILRKELSLPRLIFIASLVVFYMLQNFAMIMSVIEPLFISHRSAGSLLSMNPSTAEVLKNGLTMFFTNHGHNSGYPALIIIVSLLTLVYSKYKTRIVDKSMLGLFGFYLAIIMISTVMSLKPILAVQMKLPVLNMFQLQRFYWLLIPIQYLIFYRTVVVLGRFNLKKLAVLVVIVQLLIVTYEVNINAKQSLKALIGMKQASLNYSEFYSESLFAEIDSYINKPKNTYRVVSVGLYPSIALFNGFYTIDGYWSSGYPLEHKKRFGKVIEEEISDNPELSKTFHDWGSPCYLFSDEIDDEIGYNGGGVPIIDKNSKEDIQTLSINTSMLTQMDCQYVFSALPIINHDAINLHYERSFENSESPYRVYLYSVATTPEKTITAKY